MDNEPNLYKRKKKSWCVEMKQYLSKPMNLINWTPEPGHRKMKTSSGWEPLIAEKIRLTNAIHSYKSTTVYHMK